MRVVGLTGSIASGKSTVSRELLARGIPVIDGDQLSRELTGVGGIALPEIRLAFGDAYLYSVPGETGTGGDAGGEIVASGTPEEVAACPASFTGRFLQQLLPG